MKKSVLAVTLVLLLGIQVFAENVIMDGDFSDWSDKPAIRSNSDAPSDSGGSTSGGSSADSGSSSSEGLSADSGSSLSEGSSTDSGDSSSGDDSSGDSGVTSGGSSTVSGGGSATGSASVSAGNTGSRADDEEEDADDEDNEDDIIKAVKRSDYKISEFKWNLDKDADYLYFMINISHPNYAEGTEIITEILGETGDYEILTTYDPTDGTVMSTVLETGDIIPRGGCKYVNDGAETYVEYAVPLKMIIGEMMWSYQIKVKVRVGNDAQPRGDGNYIIMSTASSGAIYGAVIALLVAAAGYYIIQKKRKTVCC